MAVGACSCFKRLTSFPDVSMAVHVLLAGVITALVGVLFGLPSLRTKGFTWRLPRWRRSFFRCGFSTGHRGFTTIPPRGDGAMGRWGDGAMGRWGDGATLDGATGCGYRGRDHRREPVAREIERLCGIVVFVGIAGALFFAVYLGTVEVGEAFGIQKSFPVLFMVITGGLGSIFESFAGAAFMVLLPVFLKNVLVGVGVAQGTGRGSGIHDRGGVDHHVLIPEPHGLAQLWRVTKEKLRLWPFSH